MHIHFILGWLAHLHESLTLELVHAVGSVKEPPPLRVQHRVCHLPPGPTVQQHGQAHHTGHGDQNRVHRQVLCVHLEDGQQGHASDQTARRQHKSKKEGTQQVFFHFFPVKRCQKTRVEVKY